jgi:hypothetical protein
MMRRFCEKNVMRIVQPPAVYDAANPSASTEAPPSAGRVAQWAHVWSEYLRREARELSKSLINPEIMEPPGADAETASASADAETPRDH